MKCSHKLTSIKKIEVQPLAGKVMASNSFIRVGYFKIKNNYLDVNGKGNKSDKKRSKLRAKK